MSLRYIFTTMTPLIAALLVLMVMFNNPATPLPQVFVVYGLILALCITISFVGRADLNRYNLRRMALSTALPCGVLVFSYLPVPAGWNAPVLYAAAIAAGIALFFRAATTLSQAQSAWLAFTEATGTRHRPAT